MPPASELGVTSPAAIAACQHVASELQRAGATIVQIPSLHVPAVADDDAASGATEAFEQGHGISDREFGALLLDFDRDIEVYLRGRVPREADGSTSDEPVPRTLADLIAFNCSHASEELAHFGQDIFELARARAQAISAQTHSENVAAIERRAIETLHGTMDHHRVDCLLAPTCGPAWPIAPKDDFCGGLCSALAAVAGGPLITLPSGTWRGLPLGVTLMGRRFSERVLLEVAAVVEARLPVATAPRFVPSIGAEVEGACEAP